MCLSIRLCGMDNTSCYDRQSATLWATGQLNSNLKNTQNTIEKNQLNILFMDHSSGYWGFTFFFLFCDPNVCFSYIKQDFGNTLALLTLASGIIHLSSLQLDSETQE